MDRENPHEILSWTEMDVRGKRNLRTRSIKSINRT
jgi:hypothetical protein